VADVYKLDGMAAGLNLFYFDYSIISLLRLPDYPSPRVNYLN